MQLFFFYFRKERIRSKLTAIAITSARVQHLKTQQEPLSVRSEPNRPGDIRSAMGYREYRAPLVTHIFIRIHPR